MSKPESKKLLKDLGIYTMLPMLPKVASFLVLPLITPFLTTEDYGIYGLILAYQQLAIIFYYLGLPVNLSNSFFKSKHQYQWMWRQLLGFWVVWASLFGLLYALLLWFILPVEITIDRWLLIIVLIIPFSYMSFSNAGNVISQFKRKSSLVGGIRLATGILTVVFQLLFIRYFKMGYMGWVWTAFLVGLVEFLLWIPQVFFKEKLLPIFNFKRSTIKKALKVSLPILPHANALLILNKSDRIVMDHMNVNIEDQGLYNLAYTPVSIIEMFAGGYNIAIVPIVNKMLVDGKDLQRRSFFFGSQIIFFLALVMYSCVSKEMFQFIFSAPEMEAMYPFSILLAISALLKPMYLASHLPLFFYEKTKSLGLFSLLSGLINIGLNILLIPYIGILGAVISTIVGFSFLSFFRFYTAEFRENEKLSYFPTLWLIATAFVTACSYFICELSLVSRICIMLTVIPLIYITFKRFLSLDNE